MVFRSNRKIWSSKKKQLIKCTSMHEDIVSEFQGKTNKLILNWSSMRERDNSASNQRKKSRLYVVLIESYIIKKSNNRIWTSKIKIQMNSLKTSIFRICLWINSAKILLTKKIFYSWINNLNQQINYKILKNLIKFPRINKLKQILIKVFLENLNSKIFFQGLSQVKVKSKTQTL